ncbi:MAG: efflux RND transporter periplasmic adaptor subunit [Syntrophothermus sp.]
MRFREINYRRVLLNKNLLFAILFLAGLFLGWLIFHPSHEDHKTGVNTAGNAKHTIWTCSMHPQIRKDAPGKCPICGMDLIPLNQLNDSAQDEAAIHLSKEAAELANVRTTVVFRQNPIATVRLFGKVQADERAIQSQVAHVPGRIDKLLVNFTGETVRKGQPLAEIYSPELVTAQQELLETSKMKNTQPEIFEAAVEKLRQWMLTDEQIQAIISSGKLKYNTSIVSNTSGVIISRKVSTGDHVSEGTVLFEVADLSTVWLLFDAYESDIPFISVGNELSYTIQAIPGRTFTGKIGFIDPVIDPFTRVAKVRVEVNNNQGLLKPEMFATGIVKTGLRNYSNSLVIPQSAVLWTGKRSVVYVKQKGTAEPVFKLREIELGPKLSNSYIVESGLDEGEEIVSEGAFSVDAAAQLGGKPSMMNSK